MFVGSLKVNDENSRIRIQDSVPDPDPLVRGMIPRIRIHTKMSWIRNTAKNCGRPRPSHGVDNRLRLLKDLLVHEAGEVALHDLLDL